MLGAARRRRRRRSCEEEEEEEEEDDEEEERGGIRDRWRHEDKDEHPQQRTYSSIQW
jgi:hypothetical protein